MNSAKELVGKSVQNYPSADHKFVLAYQIRGTDTLEYIPIPVGKEDLMDRFISAAPDDKAIKFERANLTLWKDEILGPMEKIKFEHMRRELFTKEPSLAYQDWLQMGADLKAGKPMDKWKRKQDDSKS